MKSLGLIPSSLIGPMAKRHVQTSSDDVGRKVLTVTAKAGELIHKVEVAVEGRAAVTIDGVTYEVWTK